MMARCPARPPATMCNFGQAIAEAIADAGGRNWPAGR